MEAIYNNFFFIFLILLLIIVLGGFILILIAFNFIIKPYLDKLLAERDQSMALQKQEKNLDLSLQACERLTLLMDRMKPENLFFNYPPSQMDNSAYYKFLIENINAEYTHNITLQLHVSTQLWQHLKKTKNWLIHIINLCIKLMKKEDHGSDLAKQIIRQIEKLEENPFDYALLMIKKEYNELLS